MLRLTTVLHTLRQKKTKLMTMQTEFTTFALLSILLLTGVTGKIIQRPLNAAMAVSGETVINCSSDTTGALTWLHNTDCSSSSGTILTDSNCNIITSLTSHYRTEKPDGFVCNLVVLDIVLSLGGCYLCSDGGIGVGRVYSAFLIVIDSNAIFNGNSTDTIAGDSIMILSSVSYGGPLLQPPALPPSFYWTLQSDPNQNISSYNGSTTTNSASSYIVVTAEPPDVPPHICHLFFNPPVTVPDGCANNTPPYRTSWETPTYSVSYNIAPNITATPHFESTICEAKILSCQPNAYPSAETHWMDVQQNINIYQQYITTEYMDDYLCVATNFYRNTSYQATAPYSLSDRGQFSQTPCQFAESDKVEIILPSEARCDNFTCTCPCCTEAILKCSVPSLPDAEYRWLFGDTETEGPIIKPTADGNYTCIAHNTVNNQRFTGNKSISISHFNEFPSNCSVSSGCDETAVVVLSVFLAISILVIIGLVTWILFWLLPKMRSLQGSTSSPDDNNLKPNTAPENAPYESLQQPTASAYQELTMRHISEDDVIIG